MSLKETIEKDFITAFKSKDTNAKAALSSIKAAITVAEKASSAWSSTDAEVIKIINKGIKQREESIKMYELACRTELVNKESDEICVLRKYMPAQMTEQEIEFACKTIIDEMKKNSPYTDAAINPKTLMGKTMGEFNKRHQGMADISVVKNIIEKII
jgi:uncharacterized protein YqeY